MLRKFNVEIVYRFRLNEHDNASIKFRHESTRTDGGKYTFLFDVL